MSIIKPFYINDTSILINLSINLCKSEVEVLESKGFSILLIKMLESIDSNSNRKLYEVKSIINSEKELIELYKLLLVFSFKDAINYNSINNNFKNHKKELLFFTEELYNFWRKFERYGVIQRKISDFNSDNSILLKGTDLFQENILSLYRKVLFKLLGETISIYRQTPAGFNAGLIVSSSLNYLPKKYNNLNDIDIVNGVMIKTPFIGHSYSNSRSGLFEEIEYNPIINLKLTKRHWLCFPIKVGELFAHVYLHRELLHHGIALSNLFEFAFNDYFSKKKPNLIYVYGSQETKDDKTFFVDKENDIYVGYVSGIKENDYFGYMKKMILTLHNVYMINHYKLPIHGAMVNIVFNDNSEKNVAFIGDSGAGKSETLEALRFIADDKIKEMNIVFDDMGIFYKRNNQIYAKGTEIGAFTRLDDLDTGYAYKELDRAIFLNPERNNARIILPISSYKFIMKEHKIDYVFYANNYEDSNDSLRIFESLEDALKVFKEGKRKAKGTTSEIGLVTSYFSNPFGVIQLKEEADKLINDFFKTLFDNKIVVGELYTKLGVVNKENEGVKRAAYSILKLIR